MKSNTKLQAAGQEALTIMKQAVAAAEQFGNVRVLDAEEAIRKMANKNGFRFEDVEKEAQRISLLVK